MHVDSDKYSCKVRNEFTRSGSLKCHMHIHTGERAFSCNCKVCNKKFTQLSG